MLFGQTWNSENKTNNLVLYYASYSNKSMSIWAFLFSDTTYWFWIGLLWVSNYLSMNVYSQTNVVKEM